MSDADRTATEAKATIEKLDAMLRDGNAMLERSQKAMADMGVDPGMAQAYIARQPQDRQAQFAREVQEIRDEIERDLPKQTATRQARVRPGRQMV